MPRTLTKKRTEKFAANQDKLIKFRLMEISLKVDDYVYKSKPISESTARLYIQEVTSYKPLCSKDPRTLQVIEKLVRCMKGIINERQEFNKRSLRDGQDTIVEDKETHNNTPSPVYSVTDEDKMHISQNILEINHNEESKFLVDVETMYISSDGDDIRKNNDDNIQDNITDNDVHIEKAISNLSIQEFDEVKIKANNIDFAQNTLYCPDESIIANDRKYNQTTVPNCITTNTDVPGSYIDCSQNLLNNYNDTNNANKNLPDENVKELLTANLKKNIAAVMNNNRSILINSNKININNNPGNTNLATNTSERNIHESQTEKPVARSKIISKKLIDKLTSQHDFKIASNTSISNVITITNKEPNKASVLDHIKKSMPKKKRTVKKKTETNSCKDSKENGKTNKPSKKRAKVKHTKTNEDTKLISSNKTDFTNDSVPKIYTRNVEEDLSWIENIRYVREHVKEYDDNLMNIEESFWENYTLPAIWDDNDFLYTV